MPRSSGAASQQQPGSQPRLPGSGHAVAAALPSACRAVDGIQLTLLTQMHKPCGSQRLRRQRTQAPGLQWHRRAHLPLSSTPTLFIPSLAALVFFAHPTLAASLLGRRARLASLYTMHSRPDLIEAPMLPPIPPILARVLIFSCLLLGLTAFHLVCT